MVVGLILGLIVVLAVAGTKISQLVRTSALLETNAMFVVVTGTTTRITRSIQAYDLARSLNPWITNALGGGATMTQLNASSNAILNLASIYTNIIYLNATGSTAVINGRNLTNTVKNAPQGSLVIVGPGTYITPTNTIPSVMLSKDNVSTYWHAGASWGSGTVGGDSSFMFDDQAGSRTNCNVWGRGRFFYTNDGGNVVYLENATKMHIQALSMFATDGNGLTTASPLTWAGAACEINFDIADYLESQFYDAIYGDVSGGQKIYGYVKEIRAYGDLLELGNDSPAWGNIDLKFDIGRQTVRIGQNSFLTLGGRTRVRFNQIFVTATNSAIASSGGTNGILEGAIISFPADGKVSPISAYSAVNSGLHLRNVIIYGPTNVDIANITNTAVNPLTLENCTFYSGFGSTNWIRGSTPSFVTILGGLALEPFKPLGAQVTLTGTNYLSGLHVGGFSTMIGGLLSSNNVNVFGGDINTDQVLSSAQLDTTGDVTIGGLLAANGELRLGSKRIKILVGSDSPESVITAPPQSFYMQTNNLTSIGWWIKTSGTGNTGWWLLNPGVSFPETIVSGAGGALTNFTLLSSYGKSIINGFTNVSIRAIMGGSEGVTYTFSITITNGSGSNRTLEFSNATNDWKWSYAQGATAPTTLTNSEQIVITGELRNTNITAAYAYYPWP